MEPFDIWVEKFKSEIEAKPKQFHQFDMEVIQALFDKATSGVIAQGSPSFIGNSLADSFASYFSYHEQVYRRCPIGHILSDEQINKYNITPAKFIDKFETELIKELVPSSGEVCARHFLGKLQRAHTEAYVALKRSKGKIDFVADYKAKSNVVARYFGLNEIVS